MMQEGYTSCTRQRKPAVDERVGQAEKDGNRMEFDKLHIFTCKRSHFSNLAG
jgi:hypothetical protein